METWYNTSVTGKQAFLFAHIEPYLANVCLSVTGKLANVGCGFMFGRERCLVECIE